MRENIKIKKQIFLYIQFCNSILKRKQNKLNIWKSDHEMFLSCLFALIKLKIIEEEDSIFIAPKKKKSRLQASSNVQS